MLENIGCQTALADPVAIDPHHPLTRVLGPATPADGLVGIQLWVSGTPNVPKSLSRPRLLPRERVVQSLSVARACTYPYIGWYTGPYEWC